MLKHPFVLSHKKIVHGFYFGFKDAPIKTIRSWIDEVERMCPRIGDEELQLKFKGDMLEVLSEIFFNCFSADESVGLKDYSPIPLEEDYGVDARGTNPANRECAVQCKYKSFQPVLYEEIAKTYSSGRRMLGLDLDSPNSIYVFTTAVEFTTACDKVFGNTIRKIDLNVISRKVDNNHTFWQYAYDIIFATLDQ